MALVYTERIVELGATPSTGTVGDSLDNALAKAVNGLHKTELIRRQGPWRTLEQVEIATLEYVWWWNNQRLHGELGMRTPIEANRRTTLTSNHPWERMFLKLPNRNEAQGESDIGLLRQTQTALDTSNKGVRMLLKPQIRMNRTTKLIAVPVMVALIASGIFVSSPASATSLPSEADLVAVADSFPVEEQVIRTIDDCYAAASSAAAAASITDGYDFTCTPSGATVEPISAEGQAVIAERTASRAGDGAHTLSDPPAGDTCYIGLIWQEIVSELESRYEFCVFWGRDAPGTVNDWVDTVNVSGNIYPGYASHYLRVRMVGATHAWTTFDYDISLWRNYGILPPAEVGFTHRTLTGFNGLFSDSSWYVDNLTSQTSGTYHIRLRKFEIEVPSESFAVAASNEYAGFRFLCTEDDAPYFQCKWPGGAEAPVL